MHILQVFVAQLLVNQRYECLNGIPRVLTGNPI